MTVHDHQIVPDIIRRGLAATAVTIGERAAELF